MIIREDAIYGRQSVDRKDSISIESQIEFCKYELRGGNFRKYTDKGYSGKNTDRPKFQEMMADIRRGLIKRVVVYKLDRISRSILDFATMMETFQEYNVEFVSSTEKFDTSTPMGRAMLNICIVFAQLERETIQKRVTDAYYSRCQHGFHRPLFLLQILKERTDEDNYLTTTQLCDILKREYGLDTHRTTLKSDIEVLQRAGYSIDERRSTQNQYRFIEREFEVAELKTIIDAVASSKFIAEGKSNELIKKLTSLAGSHKARELKRNVIVDGRGKIENKQILYIIDAINDAINQRKKISFQKIEYSIKKERILHHGGERYTFSPYSLVWDGDNYYVVGYSDKYQAIGSHRVDRIAACPCILDESAVPQPVGFDISKYIKTTFRMYNAPRAEVELLCDNSVMDAIIDRFGPDVQTYAGDLQNFRVIEEIAVGKVFFNWIFGFEGKVRIKGPESVKKQYREMVMSAMNLV